MTPLELSISIALLVVSIGAAAYWGIACHRIIDTVRCLPRGIAGVKLADRAGTPEGSVCVVVPAHNERRAIPGLVASLRAQVHPSLRVVLALDRCTDDSADRARAAIDGDPRFEIVEIDECPPDWAGKVHAAWAGVTRSEGARDARYLLFTDADCNLAPDCARATIALLEDRGLDLLSLHSDQASVSWFERFVQPWACVELLRQYPLQRTNRHDERARPFANGQFMLFRADAYHAIGGHEAVKDELLEDIAFARRIRATNHRGGLLASGGIMSCRMYDSWPAFTTGWKRIFVESANRRSDRLMTSAWRVRLTGTVLPVLSAVGLALVPYHWGDAPPALLALFTLLHGLGLGLWALAMVLFARSANIPCWTVALWPVGAWLVGSILTHGAKDLRRGVPTSWGGRVYKRDDRATNRTRTQPSGAAPVSTPAPNGAGGAA
jgi:hypothetical protein